MHRISERDCSDPSYLDEQISKIISALLLTIEQFFLLEYQRNRPNQ